MAFEAISHVFLINWISLADLITRWRCIKIVPETMCSVFSFRPVMKAVSSGFSDEFVSYQILKFFSFSIYLRAIRRISFVFNIWVWDCYVMDGECKSPACGKYLSKNARNSFSSWASSTPKCVTACWTPVRGPSHSSACLSFGRINKMDRVVSVASIHITNIEFGSKHPV